MITLRSPLEVEPDPRGGWQLVFWVGSAFDLTTPFRSILGDIVESLGLDPQNDLKLPMREAGEDFVEGTFQFGAVPIRVYFEHSLSYLALMSDNELTLRDLVARVQPNVTVV